ncbi:uncharacterized protein LOC121430047 [Lytechinus variegatus]|uniref:uncharacterized protein LOC121430047 n=1 Tax=Lytechinus variegatus TaxID=7654 RepID=UPI001BB10C8E|nr:uncharacterized protein LOC121430047 [Lytechinus variegatus]
MASKFPTKVDKDKLRTRKGHDMTWSCDNLQHGEPMTFYCKQHNIPICHKCATKDHRQETCELEDIGDVIIERRENLEEKQPLIEETKLLLQKVQSKINAVSSSSSKHLETVNNKLQETFEDELKNVKEREVNLIRVINEEADEEIRKINEKREKRIKDCNIDIEKEQTTIKERETRLLSDTKTISDEVTKKINDLTNKNQHALNTMKNIESTITRINQHDETLVNEAPQVLASIDENVSLNFHQDVNDCLDRIQSEVDKVKFVEGEVGGEYYCRIDGYIGKWELVKSIHIPSGVNKPWVRGLISDDEICVEDAKNHDMYVTNINTQHTQKVIDGVSNMDITSCAPINRNVIVCGKRRCDWKGDRLDGCITLYDRQWKVIRDISIPMNEGGYSVYVDVDRDGMILAAQISQSNIYVINPDNGKIVHTVTMQGKKVLGEIQALSSGDIVVNTGYNKYTVISRSGEEKAVIHCDEWRESECRVDKLTDTIYITYRVVGKNWAVDQASRDGIIQAMGIVECVRSDRSHWLSPCLVTPSGNLVGCDGDNLLLYKKTFSL